MCNMDFLGHSSLQIHCSYLARPLEKKKKKVKISAPTYPPAHPLLACDDLSQVKEQHNYLQRLCVLPHSGCIIGCRKVTVKIIKVQSKPGPKPGSPT